MSFCMRHTCAILGSFTFSLNKLETTKIFTALHQTQKEEGPSTTHQIIHTFGVVFNKTVSIHQPIESLFLNSLIKLAFWNDMATF